MLDNKVIIVSGGCGLIGREILADIRIKNGVAINADISVETNIDECNIHSDVSNDDSIRATLQIVLNKYGKIDGLVNSAYPRTADWGIKFEDVPTESWRKNVDLQLNGCFVFCQEALAVMKMQKFGSIVNIASIYGVVGNDFTVYEEYGGTSPAAYSAIKGGIINFTRYLASYFGKYNVRINCVSPGGIIDKQHPSFIKNYEHKVPLKRMAKPHEIAPPVSFLLSDEASYITGHNLMVDGGWTAI